jgi:chromosome segregation ATPase
MLPVRARSWAGRQLRRRSPEARPAEPGDVERRLNAQRRRIEELEQRLAQWTPLVGNARVTLDVLEHQVSALEVRLADRTDAAAGTETGEPGAAATDILREVRAEHARIRSRFQVLSAYEERIRRLEVVARETVRSAEIDAVRPVGGIRARG